MPALSASVAIEFCKLCAWAHECWLNHVELFDRNQQAAELRKSFAAETLHRLSIISQEYSLLQLVKLHDRAVMNGKITLGIEYVVTNGGWSDSVQTRLEALQVKLNEFASLLRDARNKSLSHNDLETIISGATLGAFKGGAEIDYFDALQEFVNLVHGEAVGGPWPFDDLVKNDVAAFLACLKT